MAEELHQLDEQFAPLGQGRAFEQRLLGGGTIVATEAVEALCRQLEEDDVVLAVDSRAANEWPQVVRGQCGRVALSITPELRRDEAALGASVVTLAQRVRDGGGRLVLLAADSPEVVQRLAPGPVTLALDTTVREDHRLLERRPDHLVTLPLRVWLGVAPVAGPAS